MQTIQRLYLYAVTFVSLEVVLWGLISLTRSIVSGDETGGVTSQLAGALSLILVGTPVLLLHWRLAQRSASENIEERFSRLRALFLYAALLATLLPVTQNTLALLNRWLIQLFGLDPLQAVLGGDQTAADNLIAIFVNTLAGAYIFSVLHRNWLTEPSGDDFHEMRRLYRYIWLILGLGMTIFGMQQTLQFALLAYQGALNSLQALLANGLATLLVGVPILAYTSQVIQRSFSQTAERESLLRLVVLYGLIFFSVASILSLGGLVLFNLILLILGEPTKLSTFLAEISSPLSLAIPLGAVWAFYGRILDREMNAIPDQPRRAGLRRLYFYVLALLGLGATFLGLQMVLGFILELALSSDVLEGDALLEQLAAAVSTLVVGLPLWILTWRPMVVEAARDGEVGDHARRSVVRKGYLFALLFAGVMGVMFSAGVLLFQLLRTVLGDAPDNLPLEALQQLRILVLFALLLAYHWLELRSDNRIVGRSLTRRHAQFPVLILAPDENLLQDDGPLAVNGDSTGAIISETNYADILVSALQRAAPGLPVAVHRYSLGAPDEALSAAKAVIVPAGLVARPPEAIRLWLQAFPGLRLVIPTPSKGWHWLSGSGRTLPSLARQAAAAVRQLAEGEQVSSPRESSPWMILVYLLAGLFALEIVLAAIGIGTSLILR